MLASVAELQAILDEMLENSPLADVPGGQGPQASQANLAPPSSPAAFMG